MDRLQFEFTMIASNDGKTNVLSITSISTEEGKYYVLPDELKPLPPRKSAPRISCIVSTENGFLRCVGKMMDSASMMHELHMWRSE
ncbi:hypothetical protein EVAR_78648_1 [Eumeta japonica]|uniref:Uncharacterized protein n=1 Tax=Eumeta variegata TaxID=151549 RepID=A0A4C1U7V3_EUMVA|nr:hypothetical protein EVAR_78648_1 [Eumeta japonica]